MIDILRDLSAGSSRAQALHRFRHRVFVEHAGWELPGRDGLERDQFDTEQAVHLVSHHGDGRIAGQLRLLPTIRPYMIQTLWPDLMGTWPVPRSASVWEVTRLGVDPDLSPRARGQTVAELVTGCLEYGVRAGIAQMLAVMSSSHAEKIVCGMGWAYERCGPLRMLGDTPVMAVRLKLTEQALAGVRRRTRIPHRLCREPVMAKTALDVAPCGVNW